MIRSVLLAVPLLLACACGPDPAAGPEVFEIAPDVGHPGDTVVVHGVGFGAGGLEARVTLGGLHAPAAEWSDDRIVIEVPDRPAGATVLVVDLPEGVTEPFPFTVLP